MTDEALSSSACGRGEMPVKSSFRPLCRLRGTPGRGAEARLGIVGNEVSDLARDSVFKKGGEGIATGPNGEGRGGGTDDIGAVSRADASSNRAWITEDMATGVAVGVVSSDAVCLSGETCLDELAEDPELSDISVKPKIFGRLPRFLLICSESAAKTSCLRGGDRTSGKPWIGAGRERGKLEEEDDDADAEGDMDRAGMLDEARGGVEVDASSAGRENVGRFEVEVDA